MIIGVAGLAAFTAAVGWVLLNKDSKWEHVQPQEGSRRRSRMGRKRLTNRFLVKRTTKWIEESSNKMIPKCTFNQKSGWNVKRREEFLKQNEAIFVQKKIGNSTYISLR